jgi:DNA-directed RNA polymerase specialized sigma24 family protein
LEELEAVGTAAAWEAICDFDARRGVPLARFGYCRLISRCLSRYRKEWRYILHLAPGDCWEGQATTLKHSVLPAAFTKVNRARCTNNDLREVIRALPTKQRRLIEQLFWEKRTESQLASTLRANQSTINRRKRAILNKLRVTLRDRAESQRVCLKILLAVNLLSWPT